MYLLMNKDVIVANLGKRNNKWVLSHQNSEFPIGKFEINDWIEDRKAYKHNHHLKQLMKDCGCDTAEGFIRITHAASINDSFWIKEENETATWNDISFYKNNFNDTVSRLAFEGLGLYGIQMSSTSPELTTDGSFRKCWKKENGDIYLYKRGIPEIPRGNSNKMQGFHKRKYRICSVEKAGGPQYYHGRTVSIFRQSGMQGKIPEDAGS